MSEKNEVFEIIKSVITSQKGGVLLKDINRDYRNLSGEHIPYKSLGYQSVEEVLDDIPDVHSYINSDGGVVFINEGKNCEHLVELISKQKETKNNKLKLYNRGFHQKSGKPRHSMVGEMVYQHPCKIIENEDSMKNYSYSRESLHKGRIMKERNELYQENDNDTVCMMKRCVGNKTDLGKKKCANNVEKIYNISHKQKMSAHPRKSEVHSVGDFSDQGNREWKPNKGHFDEQSQLEHRQGSYSPSLCQENRIFLYKSSKLFGRRETSSQDVRYKHDHRDYRRHQPYNTDPLGKFEDTLPLGGTDCDTTNWYSSYSGSCSRGEKYASSLESKSFRATRENLPENYPNPLYRDGGFDSPRVSNQYKYSKTPKYRSYGSSRYVPEIDYWDDDTYHNHKYGGRSEMGGSSWMEGNDTYGHSGRKIDVISGSLRVTINNC